ncbi:hypothetical protein OsI_30845 [Oryza sativa Indica Group]|uniref:Uncharacterized protein n=1 Tax=Oryza sativa subsp. indica TaxID=39946 RepID=B8BE97_ORYSI|nr:hypothetical protein OsI_30845 [Oryza sativa Indica Group]
MGAVEPEPSGGGEVLEAARAGEKEEALGRERERKSSLWVSRGGAAIAAATEEAEADAAISERWIRAASGHRGGRSRHGHRRALDQSREHESLGERRGARSRLRFGIG